MTGHAIPLGMGTAARALPLLSAVDSALEAAAAAAAAGAAVGRDLGGILNLWLLPSHWPWF